jgi:hypothetical protein
LDGKVIDQETGFKVVGAIEQEITTGEQFHGILRAEIGDDASHGDAGIDGQQLARSGDGFGKGLASIGFIEKRLALEVRGLDEVAVNDFDGPNAGANEKVGRSSANGAATNDSGARSQQPLLAFEANSGEEHLPRVFFLEKISHGWRGPGRPKGQACYGT